ncbi:hypothetical protein H6F86_16205 [Phormidium sp. FACHB-592]|uniref:Prokaryotic E2 ligase family D protein n=1 Tax=Stenomitos frigidus AS-A4 TaxID=2933935 RepID=A0ABV0KQ30_9CYAN|nr:hypothetical protein [Phormidium sp. FACHB-592]MBD2075410.1 hypothetical protein [Phormidium sp. FACHB-592]
MSTPQLMPPGLLQEVLRPPPHALKDAVAELIFLEDGQLLFCSREKHVHTSKFVSPEDVKSAFNAIFSDSGWLPANVVRWGHGHGKEWVVLFKPAQVYTLSLAEPQPQQSVLRVPLPSLVILVVDHNLYVWAVKTAAFKPDTYVFHAPLPNVAQNGRVCFGANQHPPASLQTANSSWETWINGAFTAESCTNRSKAYADDVRLQLRAVDGKAKYPQADLVSYNSYFDSSVEGVIKKTLEEK